MIVVNLKNGHSQAIITVDYLRNAVLSGRAIKSDIKTISVYVLNDSIIDQITNALVLRNCFSVSDKSI